MFLATRVLRQGSECYSLNRHSIDHQPKVHPASPTHTLPPDFTSTNKPSSFSSYRQQAQQHGPLGRAKSNSDGSIGSIPGSSFGPVMPSKGEFFDRSELPARFQRSPIELTEIDAIETGGATLVCYDGLKT
ncbi:hypothetical protein GcM3_069003 [Golovinomyces cichoracearum]|uniref:Uncharacterized protein n=1 Tax=Golovinomyces cichoracearum TaxID=62708 RepID=A0A420IT69_9PEZI|nr:hypothetical protein GcM3_069003 [Golovinomyces cichoracearum]